MPSTALIITDMQRLPLSEIAAQQPAETERMIARVRETVDRVRESRRTMLLHVLQIPVWRVVEPMPMRAGWRVSDDVTGMVMDESFFEPHPETAPKEGDLLFVKPGYNMFKPIALGPYLKDNGIEKLVFAGVRTDLCVSIAVRHALKEFFKAAVLRDCTLALTQRETEAALEAMKDAGAELLTSSEFQ